MCYLLIIRDVFYKELDRVSIEGSPVQCALWALANMKRIANSVLCSAELYDPQFERFIYRLTTWAHHPAITNPRVPSMHSGRKVSLNPQLTLAL